MAYPTFRRFPRAAERFLWKFGSCALLVLVAICAAALPVRADDVSSVAQHLPPNALLAVTAGNLADASAAFQRTAIGAKLCGPEFAPLVEALAKLDRAGPLYLQPAFGFAWSDVAEVREPGGLTIFPLPEKATGMACVFVNAGAASETHPLLQKAAANFKERGYRASHRKHPAGSVSVYELPAKGSAPAETRVLLVGAGIYGVANSLAAADAILNVQAGQSLATQELFTKSTVAAAGETASAAEVTAFVRPLELWELVHKPEPDAKTDAKAKSADKASTAAKAVPAKEATTKGGSAKGADKKSATKSTEKGEKTAKKKPDPLEAYRRLGFGGVQAIHVRANFAAAEPFEMDWNARVVTKQPFERAMRMFDFKPGALIPPPAWAPAALTRLSAWRWDFATAMKGFGSLFDEQNDPGPAGEGLFEDMLDGLRDDPEGVQVDLRRELFPNLGPEMLSITDHQAKPSEKQPNVERRATVAAVREQAKVIDVLTRFYKGDERVTHTTVGKYEMWTVPEGASLFVEGESENASVVTLRVLACGEKQVVFGTDVDLVKEIISGTASTKLADETRWKQLLDWFASITGEKIDLWALVRLDEQLASSYREAATKPADKEANEKTPAGKSADPGAALWRVLFFGTGPEADNLPYAVVPSWDQVRTALSQAGLLLVPSEDGWALRSGMLRTATP